MISTTKNGAPAGVRVICNNGTATTYPGARIAPDPGPFYVIIRSDGRRLSVPASDVASIERIAGE